jgi:tetratricopeptide (TPR) repeat protein
VKRALVVFALAAAAAATAFVIQRLDRERQYRHFLASGDDALQSGNPYAAIEDFSGAIALRPDSMVAYFRRGQAYQLQRQEEQAIRDLREATRLAPDATPPLVTLGRLFDARGEPAEAAKWYGRAAERLRGEDPSLLYALALARYRAGSPATAREPLEQAIAHHDSSGQAYYLLGLVQRDLHDLDAAAAALEHAINIDRALVPAREELADLYRRQGRVADEMAQLQALAALDRQLDRRVSIALAHARHGQFDAAVATLTDGTQAEPGDSRVLLALGRVYLARAERTLDSRSGARALQSLEKALGGTARRSEGLALFGRALYLAGQHVYAERILREAVTTSPVDPEAFAYLADAAEQLAHPLEARDALLSLNLLQGDTIAAAARASRARRIGVLSLRGNDARTAATYLTQATNNGQDDGATLGLLAEAEWRSGNSAGARLTLDRALARDPQNPALTRLQRLIER